MALSVVFYVVIRGGLFASGASAAAVSPYGIAGVSSLAGMFSKQATDKLNELFSTMFQTAADATRQDKLGSLGLESSPRSNGGNGEDAESESLSL